MGGGGSYRVARVLAVAVAVAAVGTVAGCQSAKPDGCATVSVADADFGDLQHGLADQTMTASDAASKLGSIHNNLADVELAGAQQLRAPAGAASIAAGRLRVALLDGDSTNVPQLAQGLRKLMDMVSAPCL